MDLNLAQMFWKEIKKKKLMVTMPQALLLSNLWLWSWPQDQPVLMYRPSMVK